MIRAILAALLLLPLSVAGCSADGTAQEPTTSTLNYGSDYCAFVGEDQEGRVAFALDNNRGRDGEAFQAEHFVVLHDERKGWIDVLGSGPYDNLKKELDRIPDSPSFQFVGAPEAGLTITSAPNRLTLQINPIPMRHHRTDGKSRVWMGSASAVLTWQGRTIRRRAIYEYLAMPDFNRLTRTYFGLWEEFQGLYLLVNGKDDVYLHSQLSERLAPLVGNLAGFDVMNEETDYLNDLDVTVLDREFALGFYRWQTSWRIAGKATKGPAPLPLTLPGRKGMANWLPGAFSLALAAVGFPMAGA